MWAKLIIIFFYVLALLYGQSNVEYDLYFLVSSYKIHSSITSSKSNSDSSKVIVHHGYLQDVIGGKRESLGDSWRVFHNFYGYRGIAFQDGFKHIPYYLIKKAGKSFFRFSPYQLNEILLI